MVLPGGSIDDIPGFLTPAISTVYRVSDFTVAGAEALLRAIVQPPRHRDDTFELHVTIEEGAFAYCRVQPTRPTAT